MHVPKRVIRPQSQVVASAKLPTRHGTFQTHVFRTHVGNDGVDLAREHVALVHGDVIGALDLPVRLHSECLTGDALGSLRCDCRDQLEVSMRKLGAMERAAILYMRQEGRGIGLVNKVRAYALQDRGLDTVDANLALGFRDDERDYAVAAHMLASLNVGSIQLMTNNPNKIGQLSQLGVKVSGRIPHVMPATEYNRAYLETKATRSGHQMKPEGRSHLPEQDDPVILEG